MADFPFCTEGVSDCASVEWGEAIDALQQPVADLLPGLAWPIAKLPVEGGDVIGAQLSQAAIAETQIVVIVGSAGGRRWAADSRAER